MKVDGICSSNCINTQNKVNGVEQATVTVIVLQLRKKENALENTGVVYLLRSQWRVPA